MNLHQCGASVCNRRSPLSDSSCPSWLAITTVMAAAARFFIRGAHSRLSVSGVGTGAQSSFGATLLRLSPNCSSRTKTHRRHAAHFTYQPDPEPTQYGECWANRLMSANFTAKTSKFVQVRSRNRRLVSCDGNRVWLEVMNGVLHSLFIWFPKSRHAKAEWVFWC